MYYVLLFGMVIGIVAICFLLMAIGLLRGKTFTSCGRAAIVFKGEKLRCPSCPNTDGEGSGTGVCKRLQAEQEITEAHRNLF